MTIRRYDFDSVGVETGDAPVASDPVADSDLMTLGYANENYMQGGSYAADVAALKAVSAANRKNGDLRYVESLNAIFHFDDNASDTGDDATIIEPTSGSGRWLITSSAAAAGGSGINYIDNPGAEQSTTGWTTYDDAAATPVDGDGGTVTTTWTRSTSSPLRDTASFLLSKDAANRSGEGAAYAFTIDAADKSKTLSISFDVDATDTDYVDDDIYVWVYDVTNATLITPAFQKVKKAAYTFQTTFVATTSTSYRLLIHYTGTNAAAVDVKFDNVQVGPQNVVQGVPYETRDVSSLITFPSGWGSVTEKVIHMTRMVDKVRLQGSFRMGTAAAANAYIELPSGLTIDTTRHGTSTNRSYLGDMAVLRATSDQNIWSSQNGGHGYFDGTNTNRIYFAYRTGTTARQYTLDNVSGSFDSLSVIAFKLEFYVAEYAGSAAYLTSASPEFSFNTTLTDAADTTAFGYGPTGSQFGNFTTARTKRVRFLTPFQATDQIFIEIWEENHWKRLDSADIVKPYHSQNGVSYGMQLNRITGTTTDIDVQFGAYRYSNGATFGAAGSAWSSIDNDANFKWRVVKVPGQVNVAIPSNVPSSEVVAYTGNGHGATNTKIRRFTSSSTTGSDITYADSAANGATFTINKKGVYSVHYCDYSTAGVDNLGLSLNSSVLTTNITSSTRANGLLGFVTTSGAQSPASISLTRRLNVGDIIRAHTNGSVNGNGEQTWIQITQVAVTQ
jgi:hypothetical protein